MSCVVRSVIFRVVFGARSFVSLFRVVCGAFGGCSFVSLFRVVCGAFLKACDGNTSQRVKNEKTNIRERTKESMLLLAAYCANNAQCEEIWFAVNFLTRCSHKLHTNTILHNYLILERQVRFYKSNFEEH